MGTDKAASVPTGWAPVLQLHGMTYAPHADGVRARVISTPSAPGPDGLGVVRIHHIPRDLTPEQLTVVLIALSDTWEGAREEGRNELKGQVLAMWDEFTDLVGA